ncbi:MAG: hypothetical protein PWP66_564 [Thermosediminibacterales bacterium]|nr:hypothetical protein [Thermosediminibacterales bacterium]
MKLKLERRKRGLYKIFIESLSVEDMAPLLKEVKGQGGFQDLIRKLQRQYSSKNQTLVLDYSDIEKMIRYSKHYGQGGFQDRLSTIMVRINDLYSHLSNLLNNVK